MLVTAKYSLSSNQNIIYKNIVKSLKIILYLKNLFCVNLINYT